MGSAKATEGSERPLAGEAREFALRAHGGQKYGDRPYVVHLDDVARTVAELGFTTQDHQVVAYLHDVLEDTATSPSDIERRFGKEVREAVEQLTRRGDDPEYFKRMRPLAMSVNLADRLSNVRALGFSGAPDPERLCRKYERDLVSIFRACYALGDARLSQIVEVMSSELVRAAKRVNTYDPIEMLSGFYIVDERPVKVQGTTDFVKVPGAAERQLEVLAYDWETGEFVRDASYFARVTFLHDERDEVSREEFEAIVQYLRSRRSP